jgi:hypothetical protein
MKRLLAATVLLLTILGSTAAEASDYPTFGNTTLNDCSFAAAADWEIISLGVSPDPTEIVSEYNAFTNNLNEDVFPIPFFNYWETSGVGGVTILGYTNEGTTPSQIEEALRTNKALIALFQFHSGAQFGPYTMSSEGHFADVVGYTSTGPTIVTWGTTIQVTWAQWSTEVSSVYAPYTLSQLTQLEGTIVRHTPLW